MHEVETLAYTGQLPWHGIGTNLGQQGLKVTGKEMLVASGLDWETFKTPVFTQTDYTPTPAPVEGWYAVCRSDNHAALGIVKERFTCIQNSEIFGVPDTLVDSGRITYEVAGSLREGAIVFALARLSQLEIARLHGESDVVERFLLWTSGHGNGRAVVGGFTDVRVVCKNTLDAGMGSGRGERLMNRFNISHTKSGPERIAEANRILLKLDEYGEQYTQLYQTLASTPITATQATDFYTEFVDEEYKALDEEAKNYEARLQKRSDTIDELVLNFHHSPGNTGESAWDAYNGLTYWLDHQRSRVRSAATRMNSIVLGGQVYNQKGRAMRKLQALVNK